MLALQKLISKNHDIVISPDDVFSIYTNILELVQRDYKLAVLAHMIRLNKQGLTIRQIVDLLNPYDITKQTLRKHLDRLKSLSLIDIVIDKNSLRIYEPTEKLLSLSVDESDLIVKIEPNFIRYNNQLECAAMMTLFYHYSEEQPLSIKISASDIKNILKTDVSTSLILLFLNNLSLAGILKKISIIHTVSVRTEYKINRKVLQEFIQENEQTAKPIQASAIESISLNQDSETTPKIIEKANQKALHADNIEIWQKAYEYVDQNKKLISNWYFKQCPGVTDIDIDDYMNEAVLITYERFLNPNDKPDKSAIYYKLKDFMYRHRHIDKDIKQDKVSGVMNFISFCGNDISEIEKYQIVEHNSTNEYECPDDKKQLIENLLSTLKPRNAQVIRYYHGFNGISYNFAEIAERLGLCSDGYACRIYHESIEKLIKRVRNGAM